MDLPAERTRRRSTDAVTLLSFYTFLLLVIPSPLVFSPLGGAGGPATIFGVLLLVCYLLTLVNPPLALKRGPQPIRIAAVLLTCAILASYISANRHALPSLEQNGADRGVILIFGWLGIMLVAADGIPSMDRLKTLLSRIILGASAMSALAITQFFTGLNAARYIQIPGLSTQTPFTDLLTRNQLNRPSATAIDPIELAVVLAICLPIAVHRARFAPPELKRRRWLQVALIGIALPMTVSRTAIIAIVVASAVVLSTWPKRDRRVAYVVGLFGLAGMFVSVHGLLGTLGSLFTQVGSDTSSASRTSAFGSSAQFISQHPWFGRGFGTFLPAIYVFTDDQYLLSLVEIGFVGLAALLALFITGWMTARNARRLSSDPETRHLAQCLAAAVAVPTVAFATLDSLSFAMAASLTFLILGCVGALWRVVRKEVPTAGYETRPPEPGTPPPGGGPPPPEEEPPPPGPRPRPTFNLDTDDTMPIPVVSGAAVPSGTGRAR
jgi:polysaccharide biosynthesis protein PslJ